MLGHFWPLGSPVIASLLVTSPEWHASFRNIQHSKVAPCWEAEAMNEAIIGQPAVDDWEPFLCNCSNILRKRSPSLRSFRHCPIRHEVHEKRQISIQKIFLHTGHPRVHSSLRWSQVLEGWRYACNVELNG